jgi:hypothetical protein
LVPERVTMFTTAPPVCPYSAEKKFVCILNSCTTSTDGWNFRSVIPEFCSTVVTVTPSTSTSDVEFRDPLATKFVFESPRRPPDPTTPGVRYARPIVFRARFGSDKMYLLSIT